MGAYSHTRELLGGGQRDCVNNSKLMQYEMGEIKEWAFQRLQSKQKKASTREVRKLRQGGNVETFYPWEMEQLDGEIFWKLILKYSYYHFNLTFTWTGACKHSVPTSSEQHLFRAEFFRDRNWSHRIRDGSRTPLSWRDSIQITLTSWNTRWAYHNLRNSKAHCHTEVTPNNANTRLAALTTQLDFDIYPERRLTAGIKETTKTLKS